MSKTKTPNIKNTSVPPAYDPPMTTLEYLRKVQEQNAQVLARADEIEEALDGKVAKTGDTMTGDLSVPNISVDANANVGKLNSEKLNQKYEGAIKSELHVDEQGIVEFINAGNEGRFDTTRIIKPSEVKTEIYDNQQGKRMNFRLPYLEASAGDHRLLTEEDLGGGLTIERWEASTGTSETQLTNIKIDIVNNTFAVVNIHITAYTSLSAGSFIRLPLTNEQKALLTSVLGTSQHLTEGTSKPFQSLIMNSFGANLQISGDNLQLTLGRQLNASENCDIYEVISK